MINEKIVYAVARTLASRDCDVSASEAVPCVPDNQCECWLNARAAIAAHVAALEAAGFVIVPQEPTDEMFRNAMPYMDSWASNTAWWRAMIAARPDQP